MTPKQTIIHQINHHETEVVPYTLEFEWNTELRLTEFYGSADWKKWIIPYITKPWVVDNQYKQKIDDVWSRDIFGNLWRDDERVARLEKPVLAQPNFGDFQFPPVEAFLQHNDFERAREACQSFTDSFQVVHIPWGIFERSWTLRGFENALTDMVAQPDFYSELLDQITAHLMAFVQLARQLPVDGIMLGDDWGGQTGLLMGAERWRRLFKPRYERLFGAARASGKFVLTHCCGNIVEIIPDLIEIGLDVYESFQPEVMDIYGVKKQWGDKMTFWGGLGAQSLIPFGTPAAIRQEVRRMKTEMTRGGGFILAPAKAPPEETPVENLVALLESFLA